MLLLLLGVAVVLLPVGILLLKVHLLMDQLLWIGTLGQWWRPYCLWYLILKSLLLHIMRIIALILVIVVSLDNMIVLSSRSSSPRCSILQGIVIVVLVLIIKKLFRCNIDRRVINGDSESLVESVLGERKGDIDERLL